MEVYTFDKIVMQEDYDKILRLYLETTDTMEKINLFSQLVDLKKYLNNSDNIKTLIPNGYYDYIYDKELERIDNYRELNELTEELCYYWCQSLRNIGSYRENKYSLINNGLSLQSYYEELYDFFKNVIPSDLQLFVDTFENKKIQVKRSLFQREEILYLYCLKKFYIKISYNFKLNKINVRNAIHEFGHASEFFENGIGKANDYIMMEPVAVLYEILYINYIYKNNVNMQLAEYSNLFRLIRPSELENYFCLNYYKDDKRFPGMLLREISYMYDCIIAASIYMKSGSDLEKNMKFIKSRSPYEKTFDILNNIGIDEDDLIYTAKNVKRLILNRD
ncbi:MAG: hypothetical protein IJZ46_02855 [Bacilli bacterium]|nr:hypothetical protein [Bacilli bacterium]